MIEQDKQRLERIKSDASVTIRDRHWGQSESVEDLKPGDFQWLLNVLDERDRELEKLRTAIDRELFHIDTEDLSDDSVWGEIRDNLILALEGEEK